MQPRRCSFTQDSNDIMAQSRPSLFLSNLQLEIKKIQEEEDELEDDEEDVEEVVINVNIVAWGWFLTDDLHRLNTGKGKLTGIAKYIQFSHSFGQFSSNLTRDSLKSLMDGCLWQGGRICRDVQLSRATCMLFGCVGIVFRCASPLFTFYFISV